MEKFSQEVKNTYLRASCTKDRHNYKLLITKEMFVKLSVKRVSSNNKLDLFPLYDNISKEEVNIPEGKEYNLW